MIKYDFLIVHSNQYCQPWLVKYDTMARIVKFYYSKCLPIE